MPSFIQKRSAVLFAFAALFSFALVRVAEAQASTLPSCATNCVSTATQAAGCTNGNTTCLCQPSTLSPILQCISEGCTVEEKTEANEALGAECNDPIISTSVVITSATGSSSGTSETSAASSSSRTDVITLTTTLPGGSTATITATLPSVTPSPPLSFTTLIPIGPTSTVTSSSISSTGNVTSTVTASGTATGTATATATSIVIPPPVSIATPPPVSITTSASASPSSVSHPVTTAFSTVTSGNAPSPTTSTSNGERLGANGLWCFGLGLVGIMAVLNNAL